MKFKIFISIIVLLIILQTFAVFADSSELKQKWLDAKEERLNTAKEYKEIKAEYMADRSKVNEQKLIETGKKVLNLLLDEAEAWLVWKDAEVDEWNIPNELRDRIKEDININLGKVDSLRNDVDNINTRLELNIIFLKMVGKYVELVADVARDSGLIWVYIANVKADKLSEYEEKLRSIVEDSENKELINKLDIAKTEINLAKDKIDAAESAYNNIKIPGTPLIKFAEGNANLRQARDHLIKAYLKLEEVFSVITR